MTMPRGSPRDEARIRPGLGYGTELWKPRRGTRHRGLSVNVRFHTEPRFGGTSRSTPD